MSRKCSTHGRERSAYEILVKSLNKSPFGRPRHRWDNIKMYLKGIGWDGVE
jgi:hypothetical protein